MRVQSLTKQANGFIPMVLPSLFYRQVVIENAKRAMVAQRLEKVQRFKIIGAGLFMTVGPDIQIAEIDQRMCDRVGVLLDSLNGEHLLVAGVSFLKLSR